VSPRRSLKRRTGRSHQLDADRVLDASHGCRSATSDCHWEGWFNADATLWREPIRRQSILGPWRRPARRSRRPSPPT
jgi:hypothetical protein